MNRAARQPACAKPPDFPRLSRVLADRAHQRPCRTPVIARLQIADGELHPRISHAMAPPPAEPPQSRRGRERLFENLDLSLAGAGHEALAGKIAAVNAIFSERLVEVEHPEARGRHAKLELVVADEPRSRITGLGKHLTAH